jgi:hypothetical protein
VRAEIYRQDDAAHVLATARWSREGGSTLDVAATNVDGLDRLLRRIPVVARDASLLPQGSHGETVLQPDSLEWFRAALITRVEPLGLSVRFVAEEVRNGWDPAANYRRFREQAERLASS